MGGLHGITQHKIGPHSCQIGFLLPNSGVIHHIDALIGLYIQEALADAIRPNHDHTIGFLVGTKPEMKWGYAVAGDQPTQSGQQRVSKSVLGNYVI